MIVEYKHCVFCASNEKCADLIKVASDTAKMLDMMFSCDNDVVECAYHSKIKVVNEGENTSVWLSNTDLCQLVDDCMIFSVELHLAKEKNGIKAPWAKK